MLSLFMIRNYVVRACKIKHGVHIILHILDTAPAKCGKQSFQSNLSPEAKLLHPLEQ